MTEWPKHEASLLLAHNEHRAIYETAEQWALDNDSREFATWVSDEERAKAIASDSIWTLQWYPDTPVGFYCLAASSFEAVLKAAKDHDRPPPA